MSYCEKGEFSSKKVHRYVGDCYKYSIMVLKRIRLSVDYVERKEDNTELTQYLNQNCRTGLKNLENYVWIFAPVSDLDQATLLRKILVIDSCDRSVSDYITVQKTSSRLPDKF